MFCLTACCLVSFGQNERLRLMSYNLMYYRAASQPCSHTQSITARTNDFKTIVGYVNPDILAVNELGASPSNPDYILSNVLNVNGVTRYNNAIYTNNGFSSIVNMIFYDSTKVGMASQDYIENLKSRADSMNVRTIRFEIGFALKINS